MTLTDEIVKKLNPDKPENEQKTTLQKYVEPLAPLFISIVPLYISSNTNWEKVNMDTYISMACGILIPLLIKDIPFLSKFFQYLQRKFLKNSDNENYNYITKVFSNTKFFSVFSRFISHSPFIDVENKEYTPVKAIRIHKRDGLHEFEDVEYQPSKHRLNVTRYIDISTPQVLSYKNNKENCEIIFGCFQTKEVLTLVFKSYEEYRVLIDIFSNYISTSEQADKLSLSSTNLCKFVKINSYSDPEIKPLTRYNASNLENAVMDNKSKTQLLSTLEQFQSVGHKKKLASVNQKNSFTLLLHGVPGTGKTNLIFSIGNYLNRNIFFVDKTQPSELFQYFYKIPFQETLVVFDDVDFLNLEQRLEKKIPNEDNNKTPQVVPNTNLMKLMELLDGWSLPSDYAFVFTTNHPENFDPALFRPGRIGLKIEMKSMTSLEMWDQLVFNCYAMDAETWRKSFSSEQLNDLLKLGLTISQVNNQHILPNLYNFKKFVDSIQKAIDKVQNL